MPHSAAIEATIDIDWPVPNIKLLNEHNKEAVVAVVKWKQIIHILQKTSHIIFIYKLICLFRSNTINLL